MSNLYLNFHIVTLNKKNRKEDLFVLSNVEQRDVFDALKETFKKNKGILLNNKGRLLSYNVDKTKRSISGYVESGEQGFASKFVDLKSAQLVYSRRKQDLELIPFYFLISVPKDSKYCFIAVQTLGLSSPYEVISHLVKKAFNNFDATCKFKAVCENGKLIEQTLKKNGQILKIEAFKAQQPRDKAGDYVSKIYVRQEFSGFSQGILSEIRRDSSKTALSKLFAINEIDNYKLHIKDRKGKTRCLSISSNQATNYDISDIDLNEKGHPKYEELVKVVDEHMENIIELFQ